MTDVVKSIVGDLPFRDVVLVRMDRTINSGMDLVVEYRLNFYDEFGDHDFIVKSYRDGDDFDFNQPIEWLEVRIISDMRVALLKRWLRSRFDAWHLQAMGPDTLEEYLGMTMDQYVEYEKTGLLPEEWKVPNA